MKPATLEMVLAEIEAKRPVVLVTNLETGGQRLLHPGDGESESECAAVERALRVNGPVGLPIGSRSPAEIAVSVLAQVTETLRKPAP